MIVIILKLYTTWRNSDYLAGYEQQDAHEFFIASLDGIHSHHEGTPSNYITLVLYAFNFVV